MKIIKIKYFIFCVLILLLMGCLPPTEPPISSPAGSARVESEHPFKIRIRNNTDDDFERVEMRVEGRSESISKVAAGEVSEYVTFGEARQLPTLKVVVGEADYVWQPAEAAAERPLLGEFTYEIDLENGELNVSPITENAYLQDAQLYAEQTGVELDEAVSRLQSQDDVGELGALLEQEEHETFAGLWIEHEPTYRIVVALTGDGEETIQPYLEGSPLAEKVEVRSAEATYAQLQAAQQEATRLVEQLGLSATIAILIQENHVEVNVTDRARFDAALEQANATLPEHVVVIATYEPVGEHPPFALTPEPSIFMPQLQVRSAMFMQALLIGELVVQEGCLRVQSGEDPVLVIWQADYFLNNHDGTIEILDESGKVVAQVGETVYMGGGEVPFTAELESSLREPIPEGCAKSHYVWLMGEFLPEEYRKNLQE